MKWWGRFLNDAILSHWHAPGETGDMAQKKPIFHLLYGWSILDACCFAKFWYISFAKMFLFMIEIYKVVVSKYCPSHKSLNKPYVRQNTLKVCIKPYIVFWKATLNSLFPLLDIIDILNIYRLYSSDLKIRFWVYRKVGRIYDSVNAELVII